VQGVLARNCLNATTHRPDLSGNVLVLKPFTCAGIVVVRPLLYFLIAPRRRFRRDRPRRELVVSEDPTPFGSIAKRVEDVPPERRACSTSGHRSSDLVGTGGA
jgi:hypothetical protein